MTEIQSIVLRIFEAVSDICEKNNISYFAIGGTCLGAIRHGGFIPWDDDMDIAIPIEDFDRFIEIAKKQLPDELVVYTPADSRHFPSNFIKIMDTNTMMTEKRAIEWKDSYEGVWLDIMPISGVPEKDSARRKFIWKAKTHLHSGFKMKTALKHQKRLGGKILWCLYRPLYWILPKKFQWNTWLRFLRKYPFKGSKYTGYVWSGRLEKLIFPTEWFSDYVDVKFEDTTVRCPVGYKEFLKQMFGDYMKLPPEDQRNSGHGLDQGYVDLKHSYREYQSGKYKINNTL